MIGDLSFDDLKLSGFKKITNHQSQITNDNHKWCCLIWHSATEGVGYGNALIYAYKNNALQYEHIYIKRNPQLLPDALESPILNFRRAYKLQGVAGTASRLILVRQTLTGEFRGAHIIVELQEPHADNRHPGAEQRYLPLLERFRGKLHG